MQSWEIMHRSLLQEGSVTLARAEESIRIVHFRVIDTDGFS